MVLSCDGDLYNKQAPHMVVAHFIVACSFPQCVASKVARRCEGEGSCLIKTSCRNGMVWYNSKSSPGTIVGELVGELCSPSVRAHRQHICDASNTCIELFVSWLGSRYLTWSSPNCIQLHIESTKTTSMEDVSTGVLEKIKNISEGKIKPKNYMYQHIYNCICQNTKKMKIYYPLCQTYSPTVV